MRQTIEIEVTDGKQGILYDIIDYGDNIRK